MGAAEPWIAFSGFTEPRASSAAAEISSGLITNHPFVLSCGKKDTNLFIYLLRFFYRVEERGVES